MQPGRFVAIGDSFTEGVGDPHLHFPHGYRGWADRMARQLGRADPRWEYANLAIRSKRIDQVLDEQLEAAVVLRPTLATFVAGGTTCSRCGPTSAPCSPGTTRRWRRWRPSRPRWCSCDRRCCRWCTGA
ncbi:SGNH/GDSL hydrolase family protein [Angustibacter speluncae]